MQGAVILTLVACPCALASGGDSAFIYEDLEYLLLIWIGVFFCNLLAKYTGLTNILFHIIFGSICVNAKILPEKPSQFLMTFSELAITIVMFSLGLEEDVRNFMVGIKKAWGIALIGALAPFLVGYTLILLFFEDQKMAMISGLTLTATAVSLTMMSLKAYGLSKSKAAIGVMTSAVLDDIGSLALVAIMVPVLTSDEGVKIDEICLILVKAAGFFTIIAVVCKFVFPERVRLNFCCMPDKFFRKPGIRHLMRLDPHQSTLLVLIVGLGFGMLAHALGFHPGIGAYMGALILKKGYFLDYHDKDEEPIESPTSPSATAGSAPGSGTGSGNGSNIELNGSLERKSGDDPEPTVGVTADIESPVERDRIRNNPTAGVTADNEYPIARDRVNSTCDLLPASSTPASPVSTPNHNKARRPASVCVCGNRFVDDAIFCRKCGRARPGAEHDADGFEAVSHAIDNIAMSWMGPVFFVLLGCKLVIVPDILAECIPQILLLYVCMVVGQFFSASLAARYVPGGYNFVESVMIGLGMLGRAELAFVVLNIAYVENEIMNQKCFYVIMISCFMLNVTLPILIAWWRPYYLGEKALWPFMKVPQKGGNGDEKEDVTPAATDLQVHTGDGHRHRAGSSSSHHTSLKVSCAANGTILAANDNAVKLYGHRHELDLVGSKRLNGSFHDDPQAEGLVGLGDYAEWEGGPVKEGPVTILGCEFHAITHRMPVRGSVFQDNSFVRNQKYIYTITFTQGASAPSPIPAKPVHAVIVEMEELTLEKDGSWDWHETARFRKGLEEDVEVDAEGHENFDKAHFATLSVHSLLDLLEWVRKGVALLDTPAENITSLTEELKACLIEQGVLTEQQAEQVGTTMAMHHHHVTDRKKETLERMSRDEALHRCGCDVLVGSVDFLEHPLAVFIRLNEPRDLGEMTTEGHYPTKFIFLLLGPSSGLPEDYHEAGRAFSCLISNKGFLDIVSELQSKVVLCEAIHTFMGQADIIPQFHHLRFATEESIMSQSELNDSDSDDDDGRELLLTTRNKKAYQLSKAARTPAKVKPVKQIRSEIV